VGAKINHISLAAQYRKAALFAFRQEMMECADMLGHREGMKTQGPMNCFAATVAAEARHVYDKPGHYLASVEHVSAQGVRAVARVQVRVGIE